MLTKFIFSILTKLYSFTLTIWVGICKILWKHQEVDLKGKVVFITGASSGLGEALAHLFYQNGCKLILASRKRNELEKTHPAYPPTLLVLDLLNVQSIPSKAEEAWNIHKSIDILVNNAGVGFRGSILETSLDVDIRMMTINYLGHVALTKAYSATKHAMQAFFECLQAETHNLGIKVIIICPGYLQTNLSQNAVTSTGRRYGVTDKTTAKGMSPIKAAESIVEALINEKEHVLLVSILPKLAILLQTLCPRMYFWIIKKMAKNWQPSSNCYGMETDR